MGMDRIILELQAELEDTYLNFVKILENANVIIATYNDDALGDCQVFPDMGTVAFGSGLQSWAFTLNHFATLYAGKFKTDASKLIKKMWGNNFFDVKAGKWSKKEGEGADGKPLVQTVMRKWLPAAEALMEMFVLHLPSPAKAQKYRTETLYEGPIDDDCAKSMMACDKKGALMVYISKMVPPPDNSRFVAFGRVFSGLIKTGQKARIMGPNYVPGQKSDLYVKGIQRVMLMMAGKTEPVDDVPCGNTVGIVGIDQFILKTGTITDTDHVDAHNIK